jgi:NitT/TauT family transport system substrate-binding protein
MFLRRRRSAVLAAIALTATLALSACGGDDNDSDGGSGGSDGGTDSTPVALRMQFSWVNSSQFAGYLVADAKGFYDDAGLDVTLIQGGPNVNNIQQMVSGEADLAVDRISTLYQSRDKGIPIKAIAEFDQQSGFWLVAKKSSGVLEPSDLVGKRVGIYSDNVFEYEAMLAKMGVNKDDVDTFFQGFTIEPWLNDKYPVSQMTSWAELQMAYEAGVKPDEVTLFKPSDYGVGILHGSLFATEDIINSEPEALTKFVEATIKGWEYAYENPQEAVDIVVASAQDASAEHETNELAAMKDIQWGGEDSAPDDWGVIDMDDYQTDAEVVEQYGDLNGDVDVEGAVDTSIFPGK